MWVKFTSSHVPFISKFNSKNEIEIRFLTKLRTKISWLLFVAHGVDRFLGDHLYNSSAVAEMGDRGQNRPGDAMPLSRELEPRLVQCGPSRCLLPHQAASSSIQPFGHNRHGPKIGWELVCLVSGGSWFHIEHNVA